MILSLTPNLIVVNVAESVRFYSEHLDFELVSWVEKEENAKEYEWAMLVAESAVLMLHDRKNMAQELPEFTTPGPTGVTLFIKVLDVEQYYRRLKEVVTIVKDLHDEFYGAREFSFRDPDGFVVTLAQDIEEA